MFTLTRRAAFADMAKRSLIPEEMNDKGRCISKQGRWLHAFFRKDDKIDATPEQDKALETDYDIEEHLEIGQCYKFINDDMVVYRRLIYASMAHGTTYRAIIVGLGGLIISSKFLAAQNLHV